MTTSPATPVPLSASDDLSRYTLNSPVEIGYVLRTLIKSSQNVTIYFNQGKDFTLTTLLDLDMDKGNLVLDWGSSEETNRRLLASDRNVMVTAPGGVRIQFVTGTVKQIEFNGRPAFSVAVPASMVKLQRREFFRVELPISTPYQCHIPSHPAGAQKLAVHDISLGGVGLTVPEARLFSIGETYEDCRLDLRDFGLHSVTLEVRNLVTLEQRGGMLSHRMGCMFVSPKSSLQNQLQRFIAQIERERNALAKR